MTTSKRFRFVYWFLKDLIRRYRRALFFGFIGGFIVTLIFGRLAPILLSPLTRRVERIGIVGEFTPSNVPLSIQKELSLGLTTLASDGSPSAGIANSWTVEDSGKQFTFVLGDHTWHSGKSVKASDINYNIRGIKLEVVDTNTVRAMLPEPYSPFPSLVSKPLLQVGLIGVGNFKIEELKLKGDKLEMMRLISLGEPQERSKEYRFYRTENLAALAFKRGDIDRIEDISSKDILADWKKITVRATVNYDRVVALYLNMKDSILSERSVRQTLAIITPKFDEELAFSPIAKTSWAYSDKVKQYVFDPEQAKKNLASAPLPDDFAGFTITTFPQYVQVANVIAESWTNNGIPTTVKVANDVGSDYQILLSAQDLPPDPDQYPFWHSKAETNITGYTNLKIDKLLEDGRREIDQEKRKKIYADFQRVLVDDAPAIFLYHPKLYTIIRSRSMFR